MEDGSIFNGSGFGFPTTVIGELVFNTGMVGYAETMTDPSYNGQVLILTYPLIGNYGVPDPSKISEDGVSEFFESDRIQIRGLVTHEVSSVANHHNLSMTLDEWMFNEKIPGIEGIDTRELTKKIRSEGVMMCALVVSDSEIDEQKVLDNLRNGTNYDSEEFMDSVSIKKETQYGDENEKTVVVVDTGVKNAIIRNIRSIGYKVVRVPWNTTIEKILSYNPKGVVISNGPGDPKKCQPTVNTTKRLIDENIPTLGICLGAQIIALAGGADTYKLKFGHRGQNKPCLNLENQQVYVTSQNHGYCIDPKTLPNSDFNLWFSNADDKTVEGIKHKEKKCIAVQFHPEASPGPYDCKFIFEKLKSLMEEGSSAQK